MTAPPDDGPDLGPAPGTSRSHPAHLLAGARLATGLLTVLPVGAPRTDRDTAGAAMLWSPLVGAGLGAAAGLAAWTLAELGATPLIASVLAVGLLAALTRGLHLDGRADTADALGSGRDAAGALAVMKASDIGPFGVLSLLFTLLLQCTALATVLAANPDHHAVWALGLACATGRLPLLWACRRGLPAARPEGLGALVAGTVPAVATVVWLGIALWVGALIGVWTDLGAFRAVAAVALACLAAAALLQRCRTRFGGITGDVLGALVETSTTVALVVLSTS